MDDSQIVLVREPYRIVAMTGERDDNNIIGYAILTTAGARLHCGLTLDGVTARLEELIKEEGRKRESEPAAKKAKRQRL